MEELLDFENGELEKLSKLLGELQPLPQIAKRALRALDKPNATIPRISQLLKGDMALVARVLRVANSASFSLGKKVCTVNQALMILGMDKIKGIIVAASLQQNSSPCSWVEEELWEHSILCAIAAKRLSIRLKRPYAEESYVIGLLHDLGKHIMFRQAPKLYTRIYDAKSKTREENLELEIDHFGASHSTLGANVARYWNLPDKLSLFILEHHDKKGEKTREEDLEQLSVLQLANSLANYLGRRGELSASQSRVEIKRKSEELEIPKVMIEHICHEILEELAAAKDLLERR